jgi:hypothetical protein
MQRQSGKAENDLQKYAVPCILQNVFHPKDRRFKKYGILF